MPSFIGKSGITSGRSASNAISASWTTSSTEALGRLAIFWNSVCTGPGQRALTLTPVALNASEKLVTHAFGLGVHGKIGDQRQTIALAFMTDEQFAQR